MTDPKDIKKIYHEIDSLLDKENQNLILVVNKSDTGTVDMQKKFRPNWQHLPQNRFLSQP